MLTISPIRNINYYSDLAREDYYLDGGEPNGVWLGKGARLLDLKSDVQTEAYVNLMNGFTPDRGYELCQQSGKNHRPGWDLTFSAPKSVSIVWARADNDLKKQIQKSHFDAVKQALSFIEEHAAITRRNKFGLSREKVVGLVAASYEHATSRAQDPQLHTHTLIANAAPREDGTWGTLESRDLYLWHKAAGAIYRAELSSKLQELGFEVEEDKQFFKLKNIPEHICEYYSKRGNEIKKVLSERGNVKSCSKSGDIAALNNRNKKENISRFDLYRDWHQELNELGFTQEQLTKLQTFKSNEISSWIESAEKEEIELNINSLEERLSLSKSVFRMQDIYEKAAQLAQITGESAKQAQVIAKEFIELKSCISLGLDRKHNALFTTEDILNNEQAMIDGAKNLRSQQGFLVSEHQVNQAIHNKPFLLTEEQKEAVYSACQSNAFDIIQGSAGAGKSALMDCVGNAYKSLGYKVIGCAIAKSAANNLADEAKIETFTIAKLLKDKSLAENSILIVDEAGQVSTKDLRKLIDLVNRNNGKLILVGEDKQLDAIEHGGALKYLSKPEILGTTRVESIKRQREAWAREVVADFRDGKAEKALKVLNEKGLLNFAGDAEQTKDLLIKKWNKYRMNNPDKKSLLLAQRWQDVSQLNDSVRNILQEEGKIDTKELSIKCSVSGKAFTNKFSIGERIRLTQNDYSKGLSNGDLGNIVDIQAQIDGSYNFEVKLDNSNEATINSGEYCNAVGHLYMTQAYAMTVYSSQGLTIDGDVFVYYTSGMDRANTYVACSRHKDRCHLFINNKITEDLCGLEFQKKTLSALMSHVNKKSLALEQMEFFASKAKTLERVI